MTTSTSPVLFDLQSLDGLDKNVALFLNGLRMDHYRDAFRQHAIDLDFFFTLTNEDLKSIGIENEEDRKVILRAASRKNVDSDEFSASVTKEEIDAILTNSFKYLNVLKFLLKSVDRKTKKEDIRNMMLDEEASAADGIITFSEAALECVRNLKHEYLALLPKDSWKKPKSRTTRWVPVLTVLLSGMVVFGFLFRKMSKFS